MSAAACAAPGSHDDAIIAGTRDLGDPGVVAIVRNGAPHCTGTLIAPDVVLTAAHCVSSWSLSELEVVFSSNVLALDADTVAIRPRDAWVPVAYPDMAYDVALMLLAEPATVAPLPYLRTPLDPSATDQSLRVVGYGKTQPADSGGVKYEGFARILEISDAHIVHEPNTCPGDSGGPGFLTFDQRELLVGVHSRGSCGQGETSIKVRVDKHLDFISSAGSSAPADGKPTVEPPLPSYPTAMREIFDASAGDKFEREVRCSPNSFSLSIQASGGTGRPHVYLAFERKPTLDGFDVDLPGRGGLFMESDAFLPGIWNILVHAETDLSNVEIAVECSEGG